MTKWIFFIIPKIYNINKLKPKKCVIGILERIMYKWIFKKYYIKKLRFKRFFLAQNDIF